MGLGVEGEGESGIGGERTGLAPEGGNVGGGGLATDIGMML